MYSLHRRHNELDCVSDHQPSDCLLTCLFRHRPKKTSKLSVTGLCEGNSPGPVNSPHKRPVGGKCFHLMTSSFSIFLGLTSLAEFSVIMTVVKSCYLTWLLIGWQHNCQLIRSPITKQSLVHSDFKCLILLEMLYCNFTANGLNSLGPSDAIWRWRSWSTLVQLMACCLTAPSHYLNQCWLIISQVLWHSSEDIIIRRFGDTNQ